VDPATGLQDSLNGVAVGDPIAVVQPTFLYELIWNLIVAGLIVVADRRLRLGHGRVFALYVAGYTLGRFFIELLRTDPATRVFGDIRINVVVSAVVFVLAVVYFVLARGRGPREVLPTPASGPDGADAGAAPAPGEGGAAATDPDEKVPGKAGDRSS
jgi:prolipoprotein diacylglyceryltransferase